MDFNEGIDENGNKKYSIDGKPVSEKAYKHMIQEHMINSALSLQNKIKNNNCNNKLELCEHHESMLNFINELREQDDSEAIDNLEDYNDLFINTVKDIFYSEGFNAGMEHAYKSVGDICIDEYHRIKVINELAEKGLLNQSSLISKEDFNDDDEDDDE